MTVGMVLGAAATTVQVVGEEILRNLGAVLGLRSYDPMRLKKLAHVVAANAWALRRLQQADAEMSKILGQAAVPGQLALAQEQMSAGKVF